jgi:hypothetical protein
MGTFFEELIRRFNGENDGEAESISRSGRGEVDGRCRLLPTPDRTNSATYLPFLGNASPIWPAKTLPVISIAK